VSVQPEIWVERPATAVDFYERAYGARVLHRVGDGEDIVAQLAVGHGAFWVGSAAGGMGRFSPGAIGGGTCRILVTVDDPDAFVERAVHAGATETSPIAVEHGWRLGRIVDPFGHEWEIGRPPAGWPPVSS
jgi:PhnB protein